MIAPGLRRLRALLGLCGLLAGLITSGCTDWRDAVDPQRARQEPKQTRVRGARNQVAFGSIDAVLTPRARYQITAYALITDDTMRDDWSDVAALDVTFGWGPVAIPAVLKQLRFHLKRRYVSVRWDGRLPIDAHQVMNNLSNPSLDRGRCQHRPGAERNPRRRPRHSRR